MTYIYIYIFHLKSQGSIKADKLKTAIFLKNSNLYSHLHI